MQDNRYLAMALFVAGGVFIVVMTAIIRHFSPDIPTGQLIFWRASGAIGPIMIYMLARREFPEAFFTQRPGRHAIRLALGLTAMACSFAALATLSVALLTAIGFLAPVITLPLAAFFFGEELTGRRVTATLLGLVGVLFVLWHALSLPHDDALHGVILALIFAVLLAVLRIVLKDLSRTERASTITIYFAITGTIVGALTWFLGWVPMSVASCLMISGAGILGGFAHICFTEAIKRAPLSVLAPFEYTELLWAAGIDFVIFGIAPGLWGTAGMVIIVVAGMLVVSERKPKQLVR